MSGAAGWEPATEAEVALYDALAAGDQEGYFQTLGRINLLLPVSADAAAGRTPVGWGTWTANNHTHLLVFTSDQSMRTCLARHVGGARRLTLRELAAVWPHDEWWLAVNPGLPIEGYLPAWFVAQLARGDARLPGRRSSMPRDRLERVQALERAKAAKAAAPTREPIRTVATAGGPLALPPATASPRWARGSSSIVDGEEAATVLPSRTPSKPPYVPEPYQTPPVPSSQPSPAGTTRSARPDFVPIVPLPPAPPSPSSPPPLDVPVVPEPYQAPQVPPTSPGPPAQSPRIPATPPTPASIPATPPEPSAPSESRWAGLAEARWTAPTEERPVEREPRRSLFEEVRPSSRGESRSLFEEAGPASSGERRSLFDDRRPQPHDEGPEQPSARTQEPLGLRDRRRTLLDGAMGVRTKRAAAATDDQRSGRREEQPAAREQQPVVREQQPAAREEQPVVREQQPAAREDAAAGWDEHAAVRQEVAAGWQEQPIARAEPTAGREEQPAARADGPRHAEPEPEFVPANAVEQQLYEAAEAGNTDAFLSTLLLATVLIPKASGTTNGKWRPQPIDGEPHLVSYTSTQHLAEPLETISIKFVKLISEWPDPNWSFAVNPGTPVGATLPGGQLLALANWAAEVGLGGDEEEDIDEPSVKLNGTPVAGRVSAELPILQKAIAPSQVGFYLERGYDRVTGFVHRAHEVGHLKSASQMRAALGLDWERSPFSVEADEIYLLRWSAHRPSLYRIPYGGQNESAMHAMQGWVIERAPFRGNGFAPGETSEVIAEFKVDSARLPHGARLLRLKDGAEELIAVFDCDTQKWLRTDGGG